MKKSYFKIILIDDNQPMLHLLRMLLQKKYEVLPFPNVHDALREIKNEEPDLIITDVGMPYINGIDFIRHIKTSFQLSHLPILIVSGESREEIIEKIYPYSVEGIIDKPFNPNELISTVDKLIKKSYGNIFVKN